MVYRVIFKPSTSKAIASLPADVRRRVVAKAESLAADPRPNGCTKLVGFDETYRVRVGDYRVVYEVRDAVVTVLVVRVAHRREVYR